MITLTKESILKVDTTIQSKLCFMVICLVFNEKFWSLDLKHIYAGWSEASNIGKDVVSTKTACRWHEHFRNGYLSLLDEQISKSIWVN